MKYGTGVGETHEFINGLISIKTLSYLLIVFFFAKGKYSIFVISKSCEQEINIIILILSQYHFGTHLKNLQAAIIKTGGLRVMRLCTNEYILMWLLMGYESLKSVVYLLHIKTSLQPNYTWTVNLLIVQRQLKCSHMWRRYFCCLLGITKCSRSFKNHNKNEMHLIFKTSFIESLPCYLVSTSKGKTNAPQSYVVSR